jgi:hypothetical protein
MATTPSESTSGIPANPPQGKTLVGIWLALAVGGGLALLVAWKARHGPRHEGFVRLTYRQAADDGLRFDLPAGWSVVYGRQRWRGGTVVDEAGRPRFDVRLHEGDCPWTEPAEACDFPWGKVPCLTRRDRDARPFGAFPEVRNPGEFVVERAFLLGRGYLVFSVPAGRDTTLRPVLWECLRGLRRLGG